MSTERPEDQPGTTSPLADGDDSERQAGGNNHVDILHAEVEPVKGKVVTFGEAMIRLTPPAYQRLDLATSLDVTVGGAELNTAVGLACLGVASSWVTALPETAPGRMIARAARAAGVGTADIHWVGEDEGRAGIYFLEEGTDPRPSSVSYDRKGTAMSRVRPGTFDWHRIFTGASAFHVSGITLAVSDGARAEAMEAVRAANAASVPVAFDLNYRSKLWSEASARDAFRAIVPEVDILFASRGGLRTFFGIEGSYEDVMRTAIDRLGVAAIALTRKRTKGSRRLKAQSMALGKSGLLATTDWRDIEVVDRLGGGDAFAAGFLAGYLENPEALTRAVALGSAANAIKHTMPGDFLTATRAEIEGVMRGGASEVLSR